MPHRRDVEAATDAQPLGQMRKMHRRHHQIWDRLVAFMLKMMLCQPHHVVAEFIHDFGDRFGLLEDTG